MVWPHVISLVTCDAFNWDVDPIFLQFICSCCAGIWATAGWCACCFTLSFARMIAQFPWNAIPSANVMSRSSSYRCTRVNRSAFSYQVAFYIAFMVFSTNSATESRCPVERYVHAQHMLGTHGVCKSRFIIEQYVRTNASLRVSQQCIIHDSLSHFIRKILMYEHEFNMSYLVSDLRLGNCNQIRLPVIFRICHNILNLYQFDLPCPHQVPSM